MAYVTTKISGNQYSDLPFPILSTQPAAVVPNSVRGLKGLSGCTSCGSASNLGKAKRRSSAMSGLGAMSGASDNLIIDIAIKAGIFWLGHKFGHHLFGK